MFLKPILNYNNKFRRLHICSSSSSNNITTNTSKQQQQQHYQHQTTQPYGGTGFMLYSQTGGPSSSPVAGNISIPTTIATTGQPNSQFQFTYGSPQQGSSSKLIKCIYIKDSSNNSNSINSINNRNHNKCLKYHNCLNKYHLKVRVKYPDQFHSDKIKSVINHHS